MARFLFGNLPRRPGDTRWPWISERHDLQNSINSLAAQLAEASRLIARAEQTANETRREFDARLAEVFDRLAKTEQAGSDARLVLEAKLAEAGERATTAEREAAQARRELDTQLAAAAHRVASHEEALRHLADLKRSRLLKFGRLLRGMTGRPIPY